MKSKEQKRREAQIRQQSYDLHIEARFDHNRNVFRTKRSDPTEAGKMAITYLASEGVSQSQLNRLIQLHNLNMETPRSIR